MAAGQVRSGVDVGNEHHWVSVVDREGKVVLSRKPANDEQSLRELVAEVDELGDDVSWTVDLTTVYVALLVTVLADQSRMRGTDLPVLHPDDDLISELGMLTAHRAQDPGELGVAGVARDEEARREGRAQAPALVEGADPGELGVRETSVALGHLRGDVAFPVQVHLVVGGEPERAVRPDQPRRRGHPAQC